jgi:hypothetical protein
MRALREIIAKFATAITTQGHCLVSCARAASREIYVVFQPIDDDCAMSCAQCGRGGADTPGFGK